MNKTSSNFVGRNQEIKIIEKVSNERPSILIVYGRRRIGKTSLIEHALNSKTVLKIEGLEGLSKEEQIKSYFKQLILFLEREDNKNIEITMGLVKKLNPSIGWFDALGVLANYAKNKKIIIFFEEFQWLANYEDELISCLKYYWDNGFKNEKGLLLILCGSSPSFMINNVVYSKALHNRSQFEIPLQPFSIEETAKFLGKKYSKSDVLDAYLLVGGVPEYLKYLKMESSIYVSLLNNSFSKGAFFRSEANKLFISSLAKNINYKRIVNFLAKKRFATREEILLHLKLESGSNLTRLFEDLEICGVISKYTPYDKKPQSKLCRYEIADPYLQFYYKFIEPKMKNIDKGEYDSDPTNALQLSTLSQWLGYSFERFCRNNSYQISKILGFSSVEYTCGPYFNRATSKADKNYQLDLVFDRKDKVLTIVEAKYTRNPVTKRDASDFVSKIDLLRAKNRTIQTVLIATQLPTKEVVEGRYFDKIITLDELIVS